MEEIERSGTINAIEWLAEEAQEETQSTLRKYYEKEKKNASERELSLKAEISKNKLNECSQKSIILNLLYGTIIKVQDCKDIPWLAKRTAFQAQGILEVAKGLSLLDAEWSDTLQNYLRHLINQYSANDEGELHHSK